MNVVHRPDLIIAQYDGDDWEAFILEYAQGLKIVEKYDDVIKMGGSSDGGRDVVAFCSAARYEGKWDNYQCKSYKKGLTHPQVLQEIGKIIYHVSKKEFSMPRAIYFVARNDLTRTARDFLDKPSTLRQSLIDNWGQHIADEIVEGKTIKLEGDLLALLKSGDLPKCGYKTKDHVIDVHKTTAYFANRFVGGALPDYIKIPIPSDPTEQETQYIRQALDAYEDRESKKFKAVADLAGHADHQDHLYDQRELFYEAESFQRDYIEKSPSGAVEEIRGQVLSGVKPIENSKNHKDSLDRLDAVIAHAGTLNVTGLLSSKARIQVRQGFCHHLANENLLRWRKK